MKKRILALLCALAVTGTSMNFLPAFQENIAAAETSGTTYYISSLHGDNSKSGTSEGEAWETLDKLIDLQLKPGDQILLEKGSQFHDSYIHLQDVHGEAGEPIRISSYGTGDSKPAIHANGQGVWYQDYKGQMDNNNHRNKGYVSSAILLYDVDYVEISDLEITNESDDFEFFKGAVSSVSETSGRMDRTGVSGIAKDGGTSDHIYLDNLYIHDVDGNIEDKHMNNGGIQMNVIPPEDEGTTGVARYNDVKITNCYVRKVSRAGICVGYSYKNAKFNGAAISDETAQNFGQTNLVIENNYVQDIGNDAIVAMYSYRPVVQYNISDRSGADMDMSNGGYASHWQHLCAAIWPWKCKDGLFQYNEVFDTVGDNNQDAQAWDIDFSDGTVYQYNYSHNNGGGAIMFCGGEAYNGVFRYNISQNDLRQLIHVAGNPNGEIYNNVFYIDGGLSTKLFEGTGPTNVWNNIFYNTSTGRPATETIADSSRTFSNNIFFGYKGAALPGNSITEDPMFVNPGNAPKNVLEPEEGGKALLHARSVYDGYKLKDGSPAINAGVYVDGAPKYDFFGNEIGILPDIGVYESDTPETEAAIEVKTAGKTTVVVGDENITNVPKGMTVKELKDQLIVAKGVSLKVMEGTQEAADDAVVTSDMKVAVSRDSESKEYQIEIEKVYAEYDRTTMTASVGSANSDAEGAASLLDDNTDTMWHSAYSGNGPQSDMWIALDLGEEKPVAMVKYVSRASGGLNGVFEDYEVYVRNSESEDWKKIAEGTWKNSATGTTEYAKFPTVNARYVKLLCTKNRVAVGSEDKIFGSASEIRVGYEVE